LASTSPLVTVKGRPLRNLMIGDRLQLSRYFCRDLRERPVSADVAALTVDDLIARARGGDAKALAALLATGRYLGLGLGAVVNVIDPLLVNQRRMGEFKTNGGRNLLLGTTLVFALALAVAGAVKFFR
jgi:predicted NBD/HSP70 family sugar kinase